MPVKKKVTAHTSHPIKKKAPVVEEEESVEKNEEKPEEKERPVMQVVQVEEEASEVLPPTGQPVPAKESVSPTPVVSTAPVQETPAAVVSPAAEIPESDAEETPKESTPVSTGSTTSSSVVSAVTPSSSAPVASEVFRDGLPQETSSKKGLILALFLVLIVLCGAVGGYILWERGSVHLSRLSLPSFITSIIGKKSVETTGTTPVVPTKVPTPTPTIVVDKSKYAIEVLNGSGVRGAAAKLKDMLTAAGFTVSSTGNADASDYTTTQISAKASVDTAFLSVLRDTLSKAYAVSPTTALLSAQSTETIVVTLGSQTAQ